MTTRARRPRADAGELPIGLDEPNPGSAGAPPGVQVAALTLEQLMEAVGARVRDEMQSLSSTPYQPPQIQPVTPYQPLATQYQPPSTQYQSLQLPPTQQSAVGQSLPVLPSKFNDTLAELVADSSSG